MEKQTSEYLVFFFSPDISISMDKVTKLRECLDKDVQDMIFEKIKSDLGGFDKMGKEDIENMGDMVGQLSFKEMKNLDAATVTLKIALRYRFV